MRRYDEICDVYRLGSLGNVDRAIRQQAIGHVLECIQIAQEVGSDIISLWLADGTNYPGQDDLLRRRHRLLDSLQAIYAALPTGMRLLIEYKFFEPAFYSTDLPDWGTSPLLVDWTSEQDRAALTEALRAGVAAYVTKYHR